MNEPNLIDQPTKLQIIHYEVHASWWTKYLSNPYLNTLASRYFAWKVNRKYARYSMNIEIKKRVLQHMLELDFMQGKEH